MNKIIVCGAGIGGMVTAIRLAHMGYEVEIYEKNISAGGKMGEYFESGFRFDTGPSILSMPYVFRDFFNDIGKNIDDYFKLIPLDNSCRYFWKDNTIFNAYTDSESIKEEIISVFGKNEYNGFKDYLEYAEFFFDISEKNILESEFKIKNFLNAKGIKNINKFFSGKSINDLSNKFFTDPKLQQLFDRYSTFNGSSPYLSPQIFSIIPYIEFKFGTCYVDGGIYKIAKALVRLCTEYNIKINYGQRLKDIEFSSFKINKCFFEIGDNEMSEVIDFDLIVSNFTNNRKLAGKEYFKSSDWSNSGFIAIMGFDGVSENLSQHNILFSDNYENEFIDIFEKKLPAEDMTVYISISKKVHKEDAPEGMENWIVYVNAPVVTDKFSWNEKHKFEYFDKIINKINSFNIIKDDLREKIKLFKIITPEDMMNMYGSEFGSIYGLSSNSLMTMFRRPKNRSDYYENLFFTGGNTHPGGGVPLCFLSGKIVSEMIYSDYKYSNQ